MGNIYYLSEVSIKLFQLKGLEPLQWDMNLLYDTVLPETLAGKIGFPSPAKLKDASFTQNKALYFRYMPAHYYLPHHEIAIPVVDSNTQGTVNVSEKSIGYLNE